MLSTPNGALRGRVQSFKAGTRGFYYSFSGIRYGEAPIGNRRYFKNELQYNPHFLTLTLLTTDSDQPYQNNHGKASEAPFVKVTRAHIVTCC